MDVKKEMDDAVGKALRKALDEIPNKVINGIENTVAKALGFSNSWGRGWEVDHCNGRHSTVSGLVSEAAKRKVVEAIKRLSTAFKIDRSHEEALMKDMKDTYERQLRTSLRVAITTLATRRAEEMAASLVPDLSDIGTTIEALFSPEFGEREAEKAVIAVHLEEEG